MADTYQVISQVPSVQVLSPSEVVDTMEVGFVTIPSGVYAQRSVPRAAWSTGGSAAWVGPLASAIEGLFSGGLASGATFVQDVDPGTGLLADAIEFIVTYTPPPPGIGTSSATVTIPVNHLTLDTSFGGFVTGSDPAQLLSDAYNQLVSTFNL